MVKSSPKKSVVRSFIDTFKANNERGARRRLIEELFYDFNRSRAEVYRVNFVRGLFFAAGSVIGGTILIALVAWILSLLAHFVPPLGDFFNGISHTIEAGKK